MQKEIITNNTGAWKFKTWTSFLLSFGMTLAGILYLPAADIWVKGFMAMGLIFTVGSSFTLAKTIRDEHEAEKLINRVSDAKTAKILREFEE